MGRRFSIIGLIILMAVAAYAGVFTYKGLAYSPKDWPASDGMIRFCYQGKWGFEIGRASCRERV